MVLMSALAVALNPVQLPEDLYYRRISASVIGSLDVGGFKEMHSVVNDYITTIRLSGVDMLVIVFFFEEIVLNLHYSQNNQYFLICALSFFYCFWSFLRP